MCPGQHPSTRRARATSGLGLIELLVVLAIAALLAGVAYPSYQGAVQQARRTEALTWFARLQLAQARHRGNHPTYGTLAELGLATLTSGGHYGLSEQPPSAVGYEVVASARGPQVGDARCRHLLLRLEGGDLHLASGPDPNVDNAEASNRRCWAR
jgi:type IV pilus assembly protein PilE